MDGRKPSFGELLERVSTNAFVGRGPELARFRFLLAGPTGRIIWLHGPGGVGKSTLLRRFLDEGAQAGLQTLRLDFRDTTASPHTVLGALGAQLHIPPDQVVPQLGGGNRRILGLDTFEHADGLAGWLQHQFLPRVAGDTLIVVAGRVPPAGPWREPGWRDLVEPMALSNLSVDESLEFLARQSVRHNLRQSLVEQTHGHPLALSLVAELTSRHPSAEIQLAESPDVVAELFERFISDVPTALHHKALAMCAHARFTTEDMLRSMVSLEPDVAGRLFQWLAQLPFIKRGQAGLYPHDVARDVIDADARWRDLEAYQQLHLELRRYCIRALRSAGDAQRERAFLNWFYLGRVQTLSRQVVNYDALGSGWASAPEPHEFDALAAITRDAWGPDTASVVRAWLARPESEAAALRAPDGEPVGFAMRLLLTGRVPEVDDPVVDAVWTQLERDGDPPTSILLSRVHAQSPRWPAEQTRLRHDRGAMRGLTTPGLDAVVYAQPDIARYAPAIAMYGATYLEGLTMTMDGHSHPALIIDLRRLPPSLLSERVAHLEQGMPFAPTEAQASPERTLAGRYRLGARIGAGGMGVVYRAEQLPIGRPVAVKLLRAERYYHPTAAQRFEREAQALSRLSSPHLVTLYDFGRTDEGELYLVMEFLEGRTLRARLEADGPIDLEDAVAILDQVGRGLAVAHSAGVVHRDLKPDNILLTSSADYDPLAKVLDFGLATQASDDAPHLTGSGELPGTLAYLAPERITGETTDARVDVYALGVMMYEMLTGRLPLWHRRPADLLEAQLHQEPPPLSEVAPGLVVPTSVEAFLWRCLAKAPALRPRDGADFRLQLADAVGRRLSSDHGFTQTSG